MPNPRSKTLIADDSVLQVQNSGVKNDLTKRAPSVIREAKEYLWGSGFYIRSIPLQDLKPAEERRSVLAEDDSVEGVEPQDEQDWACYLAPYMLTLLVLLGAVHRTTNKQVVSTKMVRTSNEKRDVSTKMVRTSDKKRAIVGTKSGTDQDYHGRILKTHSRSEYNSTSEELVDENREGFVIVITERNKKLIGYVSLSIQIPPLVQRARLIATASNTYSRRSRLLWNWYYRGCFG